MGSSSLTKDQTQAPLHWEHGVLVTALAVKSLLVLFNHLFYSFIIVETLNHEVLIDTVGIVNRSDGENGNMRERQRLVSDQSVSSQ